MKKTNIYKAMALGLAFVSMAFWFSSCKKDKNSDPAPTTNSGTVVVQDSISGNVHWTADKHYLLKGWIYVVNGATLTIDPGTVIKGDKESKAALIVERGAKIYAVGSAAQPIIFTSNQPAGSRNYGDWGGVILCGKAKTNWVAAKKDGTTTLDPGVGQVEGGPRSLYGGSDDNDNSGTLQYVRIEFGGVAFSPNNEVNGLTLCAVGTGTTIDHVQISYSGDDAIEWFGGAVNTKYMIAHRSWDDDFDNDCGFTGHLQFGMVLRDPQAADYSGSHSIESDSRNENSTALPLTSPVFANITMVGPLTSPAYNGYNTNYVCGAILRRASAASIMNSLIIGYPSGIIFEDNLSKGSTANNLLGPDSLAQIRNTAIVGYPSYAQALLYHIDDNHSAPNPVTGDADTTNVFGSSAGPYTYASAMKDKFYATEGLSTKLTNPFNLTSPNFVPTSSSVVVNGSLNAGWSSARLQSSFFDKTANYVGGFNYTGLNTDNWATGWTNFDPQTADYGSAY